MKITNAVISHTIAVLFTAAAMLVVVMMLFEPVPRGAATAANTPVTTPSSLQRQEIPGCIYIDPRLSEKF